MKPGYTIRHTDIASIPSNIYIYNYENNNSIALTYVSYNYNSNAHHELIGRWKIKYYFDI